MLVTVNNRLKFEIEIVHDPSCHPLVTVILMSPITVLTYLWWDFFQSSGAVLSGFVYFVRELCILFNSLYINDECSVGSEVNEPTVRGLDCAGICSLL